MKNLNKKDIEDILPLTPMQGGMLFHYLKDPASDHYFEQLSLTIQGKIEIELFELAWNFVVRANEILRVMFQWEKVENPVQIIFKKHKLKPGYFDFSGIDGNEIQKRLEELKIEDREKKFDLRQVPFRITLCKIKNHEYQMIISNHHILYDGWSTGIILEEFVKAYEGLTNDSKLKPVKAKSPVKTKYKEFVKWIQKKEKENKKNREEFWKSYLNGFHTPTRLPIKTKRLENGKVKNYQVKFDKNLTGKLKGFVSRNKTTLAALLYSTWGILLQKYNNSNDVIFGTTVSGRSAKLKGIERMVGLFINTLPLRFNLPPGTGVLKTISKVDAELREREAYESTPLVDIKTLGKIDGREELFDSVVVIENYPLENILAHETGNGNLSIQSYSIFERTNYDLTLGITISAEIKIDFIYSEKCLDKDTVIMLSRHFANVIRTLAAVTGPRETLSEIEIIPAIEKEQILYEFNGKEPVYPIDKNLCQLFAAQVEVTPDHIAALSVAHGPGEGQSVTGKENFQITYRELNRCSHQLSHLLVEKGARHETLVALEGERSLEMVTGIWGIVMAGCGYVPLDPKAPAARNKYILEECDIGILLTTAKFKVKAEVEERFIETIDISQLLSSPPSTLTSTCHVSSANLAYVIFTSGSTGKPKGVPITHSNLSPLLHWGYRHLGINSTDCILHNPSYFFDFSVWEIFITLTSGAGLVIVPEEVRLNPGLCIEAMQKYDITVLHITPAQYQTIANEAIASGRRLDTLKYLCIGAEKLTHDLVNRSYGLVRGNCRIFNMYGPTEAAIMAAVLEIDPLKDEIYRQLSSIPIGIPIANSTLLVLDQDLNLCPVLVKGELYIAGDGLSRGYLNDPEKTSSVFIKNNFHQVRGSTLYKTGDVVRWLGDGSIEYMGRVDTQVKVRGFRIEPGEIENRLLAHQWIIETIVIAKKNPGGETYLCAYVVLADVPGKETDGWPGELRTYLLKYLPDYMVPSYFVSLERIPLTPNGKINLEALPQPQITPGISYSPPRNTRERTLVNIWSEVLHIDGKKIGIDDDFFQLGGHSLKATTLMSKIHQQLKFKIPLADLFILPTVREQAAYMNDMEECLYSAVQPVEEREYYNLSFAQRRLWIICQFEEDSTTYNMVGSFDITGPFNAKAFEQTIQTLVNRHDSFRTTFINVEGKTKQKILKNYKYKQEVEDLRPISGPGKEKKVKEIMERDANKSFDLENGPLFLFTLMRLEDEAHILLVNIHHIINDGWSLGIINNELLTLYNAYSRNQEHHYPPLQLQYKDYTLWHNWMVEEKHFDQFGEYWLEKFRDKPNGMELPIDHPRGAIQTFRGGRVYFTVNREQTAQLHRLYPGEEASIFMKLLSLLNILFYHYTGQRDILIGAPIFNRKKPELHHVVGFLVNTLVFRNDLNSDESFRLLLRKIKKETMDCYENQDYPFDVLVERLEMDRDLSRSPLFNFMLAFDNTGISNPDLTMAGVDFKRNYLVHYFTPTMFDMLFHMNETHGQLNGEIMYNRDLFERCSIEGMKENFLTLVNSVLENSEVPVYTLSYLHERELETIIHHFNQTEDLFPQLTIQEMLENQAEKTPTVTAVVLHEESLTYGELNRKANQLAHYLRDEFHVRRGDMVGVSIDRSTEMIAVILGVVKTGAGYAAIDPGYPQERVLHMLTDSQAKLVVIDEMRPLLFGNYNGQLINYREKSQPISLKPGKNPGGLVQPDDIVYVIYTSGSTGTPNGAMLSQGLLSNLVQWQSKNSGIDSCLRCLQFTSINFCVSFQEIFITLTSGGELHLIDDIMRRDINYLLDFLVAHRVEILYLPFSYLNHLFNESRRWGHSWKHHLKHIVTAGEQLKITSGLREFLTLNPGVKLHNHYGSSEMHVVTSYLLDGSTVDKWPVPPAGKPISNTRIYILDEHYNPVPIGVYGELCIAGSWEVPGYINNKALTDEKLLAHPSLPGDNKRLYCSGDIGRWLPDGNIELRGRKDTQVKIRGYRVEVSEVESKILAVDSVKDCVVIVKGDESQSSGGRYLVAYVVLDNNSIDTTAIKKHLANYLPLYMIPEFMVLESLPLMPNGKVDRENLPEPLKEGDPTSHIKKPGNPGEEKLVELWAEVLEMETTAVSVEDNFFEVGGHSLKATQLMAKILQCFQVKIKLIEIFQNPTIREIAASIKKESAREGETVNPAELRTHYPLSPAQKRLYMVQQIEANATNYNMFDTVELLGKLDKEKFENTFRQLIQRHESFRTSFLTVEEVPVQRVHDKVVFEIEYDDIPGVEVKIEEVISSFVRSFDLAQAPLLRVGLIKSDPERHILMVDMNHIISDGTSIGIFIKDFMALYRGEQLTSFPLQYKDYAQWQDSNQYRESIKNQEQYWINQYQGEIPRLNLPLDYPRPSIQGFAGDFVLFELDAGITSQLNRLALEEEATLYMVLLALYNILLSKLTRQEDIIVGTPTAGRKYAPLQNLIGMFVNTLTMRNFPVKVKTFKEFLKEVKVRTLQAFTNQDYPFEELVDHVAPHRDSSRNPIFDVMFALQNMEIPEAEMPGLKLKPYPHHMHACPFDMLLDAEEKDGKLLFKFRFCTALFKKDKIERFIRGFKEITDHVIENKTLTLEDIKISHDLKEKQLIIPQQVREGFNFN